MKTTTPTQDFVRGIWKENPVLIQMLGLCPALAVTNSAISSRSFTWLASETSTGPPSSVNALMAMVGRS